MNKYNIETNCVQAGYNPKSGEPRVMPISQSTTYYYEKGEDVAKLFDLEPGYMYTRLGNPTFDVVQNKIAMLEGGVGALLTSSGQAATTLAILNICHSGDHIVAINALYGGTMNLLGFTFKRMGINTTFVNTDITEEDLRKQIKENTKVIFIETLTNPGLEIPDIEMFVKVAHDNGIIVICDNTFATPILCRPFDYGVDIIVHSTSKYMDGHAVSLGGCIVDSGNANWNTGKYPDLVNPDPSYHGVSYTKEFGKAAFIVKANVQLMRDLGSTPSPMNVFLLNLGLESLHVRIERHCENAYKVAKFLDNHDKVTWVNYPALEGNKYYNMFKKYMPKGTSGVISFGVKGGKNAAMKVMDSLELASIVVHVADARTSILHPASTTHRQLTDEQLREAGILPELLRFSVGIENVEDIISDLEQALEKI